jgi:DNA-binding transcriptional LysR family regulator
MELRHLRYFVALAEELNFTRAAEILRITQPSLSSQIRQLEKEIGATLLRRETRGIKLTDAGRLLYEEARGVLRDIERTKAGVASRERGETGVINLGSSSTIFAHPVVPAILREFKEQFPDVAVVPEESSTSMLLARVRAGAIDVAFIRSPVDPEGLRLELLVSEPIVIVVPEQHPLARAKSAPLSSIAKERIILFPRTIHPWVYDALLAEFVRAGFSARLGQEAPHPASSLPMVAAGFGITVVPESMAHLQVEGVAFVRAEGMELRGEISLAYSRNHRSAAVKNFVSVARRLTGSVDRS